MAALFAGARILIVDDRDANVLLLETILRAEGVVNIEGLTDPQQAVTRCLEYRPDVLLLDLHMPGMDGFAVMRELRARLEPDVFLPVVVLTADATPAARVRALDAGAKDFLTKPIDRVEVLLRIRNLLETCALYAAAQAREQELQRELDERTAEDRRCAQERCHRIEVFGQVLEGDGLGIVFQPIVELATGSVVGVEALARFAHEPVRPPDEWFAEARELGLAHQLELLSVRRALDVALALVDERTATLRQTMTELEAARASAEAANQAKSEFLSRMSHDLRTPLNAVLGFAQVLELGDLTDPQRQAVTQISKGGQHLLELINDVLDISRIETGNLTLSPEPVLVDDVVDDVLDLVEPLAAQRDIRCTAARGDGESTYVLADRQRLKQILLNLLANAVKYNHPGGAVTISCVPADEGRRLRINVTDTGPRHSRRPPRSTLRTIRSARRRTDQRRGRGHRARPLSPPRRSDGRRARRRLRRG